MSPPSVPVSRAILETSVAGTIDTRETSAGATGVGVGAEATSSAPHAVRPSTRTAASVRMPL